MVLGDILGSLRGRRQRPRTFGKVAATRPIVHGSTLPAKMTGAAAIDYTLETYGTAGHPHQQRRHLQAGLPSSTPTSRSGAGSWRVNSTGCIPRHQARGAGDAALGRRVDNQHLVHCRAGGQHPRQRLRRVEGQRPPVHQVHRLYSTPPTNIRANSIHPGPIDTEMIAENLVNAGRPEPSRKLEGPAPGA